MFDEVYHRWITVIFLKHRFSLNVLKEGGSSQTMKLPIFSDDLYSFYSFIYVCPITIIMTSKLIGASGKIKWCKTDDNGIYQNRIFPSETTVFIPQYSLWLFRPVAPWHDRTTDRFHFLCFALTVAVLSWSILTVAFDLEHRSFPFLHWS